MPKKAVKVKQPRNTRGQRFSLRVAVLGARDHGSLRSADFFGLRDGRRLINEALSIEENYNGLIERYIKLQVAFVEVISDMALRSVNDWSSFAQHNQTLNREVACLLSSARQYIDHALRAGSDIEEGRRIKLEVKSILSRQYDKSLGYRVLEALRNVAQHRTLPSQGLAVGGGYVGEGEGRAMKHSARLYLVPELLAEHRFKSSVLAELASLGEKVDFMPLLKEYLGGIAAVQAGIRAALDEHLEEAGNLIDSVLSKWTAQGGSTVGLSAVRTVNDEVVEEFRVTSNQVDRLRALRSRNRTSRAMFAFTIEV